MDRKSILFVGYFLVSLSLVAQEKGEELDAVILTADTPLRDFSETQQVSRLTDSVAKRSQPSLTNLLQFNTPIYFKENGAGMVSSPSFRGTTAAQTAVVWNGININSLTTGQTDFNTVSIRGADHITVKSGGGSVAYGSSAIGGTIHLNNDITFNTFEETTVKHTIFGGYGSFESYDISYATNIKTSKADVSISLSRNQSENDYPFVDDRNNRKNKNGQYFTNNLQVNFGYTLNASNILKFYSNTFDSERHFSLISPNSPKTKYQDFNTRNLIEWVGLYGKWTSKLKLAYLTERYRYFPNIDNDAYTFGETDSKIAKYDLGVSVKKGLQINLILDYMQNQGNGSDLQPTTRHIGGASLMVHHQLLDKLMYEASFRQEVTSVYKSPFLYNFGLRWQAAHFFALKANTSKNFRMPTFNDMYWATGGNPNLLPETSNQVEVSAEFSYKKVRLSLTAYKNDIDNMIRWVPVDGDFWQPENVDETEIYGLESSLSYKVVLQQHQFEVLGTYAYTISENEKTKNQLTYVPFHKATSSISYAYKNLLLYHQFVYNGEVFTTSDNSETLQSYTVSNVGAEWNFKEKYTFGAKINNVFNTPYESVLNRPMPGRHFNFYINLNF